MIRTVLLSMAATAIFALPAAAAVDNPGLLSVAVGGYDLVSYHQGAKPLPGNGNHTVEHGGTTYLFVDADNARAFEADPAKYLPAYGGYCAFGVSLGKKFVGDPDVWEIVDGRLYLNLDNKIKGMWSKDIEGHLAKSEKNWPKIRDTQPSEL